MYLTVDRHSVALLVPLDGVILPALPRVHQAGEVGGGAKSGQQAKLQL